MKKLKYILFSLAHFYSVFLYEYKTAQAQIPLDSSLKPSTLPGGQAFNSNQQTQPEELVITSLGNIINLLMILSGSLAVFFIVYAGFQYVASRGDDSGISKAKNTLNWTIIGLITMFFAMAIVRFVLKVSLALEEVN